MTRGVVVTAALTAIVGVSVPGTAVARTAGAVSPADGIGTSDKQRIDAASVVRLDPTPDVLLLGDRDFIHALWQKARDAGESLDAVRVAAEGAMASPLAEDHVRFITTGIHEAYKLDQQREKDRDAAERAARLAKSQALLVVGIPSTPELLALSDENFIREIMKHPASGPEVRAGAARVLSGNQDAWREFIVNGVREAHQRDVANELKELEEKNRQEAERRKELAARKTVAALFRIMPSEAMLSLSDDNFIRELLRLAPADSQDTELYTAGQRAVSSSNPADWKQFIHSGAEQAYKRDDAARRKKIADANRRLAQQIQAAAEKAGVNPGLAAAAEKALAGSDEDVAQFLKEENQYRARRQSLQAVGIKVAGWYLRQSSVDGGETFVAPVDAKSNQSDREDATWVIVPALASRPGCYSFESARKPGYYLSAAKDIQVRMVPDDGSTQFSKDSTWCARKGYAGYGTSFESASMPGRWLRRGWGAVWATLTTSTAGFEEEATWKIAPPLAR